MSEIPTQPVWMVFGINKEGHYKVIEQFTSPGEAALRADVLRSERNELMIEIHETERITPDRTLPTRDQERELGKVMHLAFVAIRSLARDKEPELIEALADVFHNLPSEMFDGERWDWNYLERSLQQFHEKYPKASLFNFAAMIDEIRNPAEQSHPPDA